MKKSVQKIAIVILLCFSISLAFDIPAYAHRMLIEPVEPGLIRVFFADNSAAIGAEVVFYDENEQQLLVGKVDQEGYYKYDKNLPIALVIADDGAGHRATWNYGEEVVHESVLPKVVLTIAVLFAVGAFSYYQTQKRKNHKNKGTGSF